MAETQGGRWVTMRGTHVFIKDAPGGKAEANHSPSNLRVPPRSHSPGHENASPSARFSHTGLTTADQHLGMPPGQKRPAWMSAANARQVAKSERLARAKTTQGKPVPKGTPWPKMKPMPAGDPIKAHQRAEDTSLRVHLYGSRQG